MPLQIIVGAQWGDEGNGMVVNPRSLLEEMDALQAASVTATPEWPRISYAAPALDPQPVLESFKTYAEALTPYIANTAGELHDALQDGATVVTEGAQGTLLDLDHGTYPFVTSSSMVAPGALTGLGLGFSAAKDARVIGVIKAFQTRVDAGPFPTEVFDETAECLRGTGEHAWDEFGTTEPVYKELPGWSEDVRAVRQMMPQSTKSQSTNIPTKE